HRTPTTEFDDALGRSVLFREIALLVVAGAIASLMHGLAEQPYRAELVVEGNHRSKPGHLVEQVEKRLHEIVRLYRTARNVYNRPARLRPPIPTQIVGQTHAAGWISGHRVDASVGRARADGDYAKRLRRQPVNPFVGGDGLPRSGVRA